MSRPIENPGEPEDYIAGLRNKGPANFHVTDAQDQGPFTRSVDATQTVKPIIHVDRGGVGLLLAGALFMVGCVIGAVFKPAEVQYEETAPATPRPAVTVTKTVTDMPEVCRRALKSASEILEQAAATASVSDKQLDILSEAYQAILQKDWRQLNTIADKQRTLERELAQYNVEFLPGYLEVKRDLEKCASK